MNVENFVETSEQIEAAKSKIIDTLAGLHVDLCELAKLERALEVERQKGETIHTGLKHNDPALVEHLDAFARQVQVPSQKIWNNVDSSISLIWQINDTTARAELPVLFERSNRIEDFTKG